MLIERFSCAVIRTELNKFVVKLFSPYRVSASLVRAYEKKSTTTHKKCLSAVLGLVVVGLFSIFPSYAEAVILYEQPISTTMTETGTVNDFLPIFPSANRICVPVSSVDKLGYVSLVLDSGNVGTTTDVRLAVQGFQNSICTATTTNIYESFDDIKTVGQDDLIVWDLTDNNFTLATTSSILISAGRASIGTPVCNFPSQFDCAYWGTAGGAPYALITDSLSFGGQQSGFTSYSPPSGTITPSNNVTFASTFYNGVPELDSSWDMCFDVYPISHGEYQNPYIVTYCEPITLSGGNTMSTTTQVAFGISNLLWYVQDSAGEKRFAVAYNINVGGYNDPYSFVTMLPTTDEEATASATSTVSSFYSFFRGVIYKFPFSWAMDIFTIFNNLDETTAEEFDPIIIEFENMPLEVWEKIPNATTTLHELGYSANFSLFSTTTLQEVADIEAMGTMRFLLASVLWIGLAVFVSKETMAMFDNVDKN